MIGKDTGILGNSLWSAIFSPLGRKLCSDVKGNYELLQTVIYSSPQLTSRLDAKFQHIKCIGIFPQDLARKFYAMTTPRKVKKHLWAY